MEGGEAAMQHSFVRYVNTYIHTLYKQQTLSDPPIL